VQILAPDVARRIAAGEVIERPASVVRELIDNSLDAGADTIDISWTAGGTELLRVRDNGIGLSSDDLAMCWQPHATSKIQTMEDLEHTKSLGFRGEALSSIAAVSTLTITTAQENAHRGHQLTVDRAATRNIQPAPPTKGTTVEVRRLFANLPARRRFLSRPQAETTAIRNTILDKALPFPQVRFTWQSDKGRQNVLTPRDRIGRTADVYGTVAPEQSLEEISGSGEGFHITIVAARPEIVRRDRRYIRVFVNNRRVSDYSLIQAVEYAYQDVQHGGLYPVAAVFVDIDPELVDFNIHPAKKEVRIRPAAEVHHRTVEILRSFLRAYTIRTVQYDREFGDTSFRSSAPRSAAPRSRDPHSAVPHSPVPHSAPPRSPATHQPTIKPYAVSERPSFAPDIRAVPDPTPDTDMRHARAAATSPTLTVHGTLFETYIIAEWEDRAFLIDQHAAHERIIYNRLRDNRLSQTLLVPEEFTVTDDQHTHLTTHAAEYQNIGITLTHQKDRTWHITTVPPEYRDNAETLIEMILELEGLNEQYDRNILAALACKAAVKGGDFMDTLTALELTRKTLQLDPPRCPHGRPLWIELTRHRLDTLIGRT